MPGARDAGELFGVQVGDEAQHPGVAGQSAQVLDPLDEVEPFVGGRLVTVVTVHQVGTDLRGGELLDVEDPALRQQADLRAERGEHLRVGLEVVGPAGNDDLRVVAGGRQQRVEMVRGPVVGDPADQLVEPVEEQDDTAAAQQVAERLQVDEVPPVVGEVGGDHPVDVVRLVQGAQLDEDRCQMGQLGRYAPGDLPQGEALAPAEVPEDEDETAVVLAEQPQQFVREALMDGAVHADEIAVTLRHVQLRPVARVVHQPGGLVRHEVAEVQQPLELGEAAYPHPAAQRLLPQGLVHRKVGDDLRVEIGRQGVHVMDEGLHLGQADRSEVGADAQLPNVAVVVVGDQQMRDGAPDLADPGLVVAGPADVGDPLELRQERVGRLVRGAGVGIATAPGLGDVDRGIRPAAAYRAGEGRADGVPGAAQPPRRPGPGSAAHRPGRAVTVGPPGQAVRVDRQQLEPAGSGRRDHRQAGLQRTGDRRGPGRRRAGATRPRPRSRAR